MAIIDSVLVGKGRGKIGNVVLQGIKGQTVAKQLNPAPSNPRTNLQTISRTKMSNVVLAFQFLAVFLENAKALRKPLESVYNAFVRLHKNVMTDVPAVNRISAAMNAFEAFMWAGNWISMDSITVAVDASDFNFQTGGLSHVVGTRIQCIGFDLDGQSYTLADKEVTAEDWTLMSVTVPSMTTDYNAIAAYLFTPDGAKISSLIYQVVV